MPRCKCCSDIKETSNVVFHKTGQDFKITSELTCESKNLIYVIFCNGCDEYYIGETSDHLRARARVHRQGIVNNTSIAVDRHIFSCAKHLSNKFEIIPFYKMKTSSKSERLAKEAYFISKFNSTLNQDCKHS